MRAQICAFVISLILFPAAAEAQWQVWLVKIGKQVIGWTAGFLAGKAAEKYILGEEERQLVVIRNEIMAALRERDSPELRRDLAFVKIQLATVQELMKDTPSRSELHRLFEEVVQQQNSLERRLGQVESDVSHLRARIVEHERAIGEVQRGLRTVQNDVDVVKDLLDMKARRWYIEVLGTGDVYQYEENDREADISSELEGGTRFGAGYVGPQNTLAAVLERPGSVVFRNPNTRSDIAEMSRLRTTGFVDVGFTQKPGLRLRASAEYRGDRIVSLRNPELSIQARSLVAGFGIGYGGWNHYRTRGGGIHADFLSGQADVELTTRSTGVTANEEVDAGVRRVEVWGAVRGRQSWIMVTASLFYEQSSMSLKEEAIPNFDIVLFESDARSVGVTLGVRFLVR